MDFSFFAEIIPKLLTGLPLTLELAGQSILCGAILAVILALVRRHQARTLRLTHNSISSSSASCTGMFW